MNSQNKMVYMQKILNPSQYRSNGLSTLNRDNFARIMSESITKALSSNEDKVKEKHVRKLLIGSYQAESGAFFWEYLPTIRLKENQIICWKFCHVLHKMIRDGHRQVIVTAYERRQILLDCGNMWRHVEDGYGPLIHIYCTLLYNRINFLTRNPRFPNDLKLTDDQIDEIGENDPNVFFDLSCELFDLLDDILKLHKAVFAALGKKQQYNPRYNSMTNVGQCLLSPIVSCIQDSSVLYDYTVKILFKLHGSLPSATLSGHRSRFSTLHEDFRAYYTSSSNLQYFKQLIQIPCLPETPPNFLIASNLQQHVTPRVIMISNEDQSSESPDQLLVNLDDDSAQDETDTMSVVTSSSRQETSSAFSSMPASNHNQQESRVDVMFDQACDPFQTQTYPKQLEQQQQQSMQPDQRDERIHELEIIVAQLRSELDMANSNYETMREQSDVDIKKLRNEVSNLKHQLIASKNAYDKLDAECQRAKHENEISQVAMRRLAMDMNELKGKQKEHADSLSREREIAQLEADKREEDLLVAEMNATDKIIKEATRKIEELSEKSRKEETGIKLQVNEKISEVCTNLMKAVRNLIAQSRVLQREIVGEDKVGKTNSEEFYKRNSSWTDGLISAATEVAMAAKSLVDAADRSMSGSARFSELAAAAHQVATATTQLVVASRVKANKDSEKLKNLTGAAKQVNQCTSNVVDASRVCAQLIDQDVEKLDISSLSLHQTKKMEMESQVRLLELEEQLSKERMRLGLLRRQHYEQEDAQEASVSSSDQAP